MEKKLRIPVASGLRAELGKPFAELELIGLPPGPPEAEMPENRTMKVPRGKLVFRKEKARRGGKSVVIVSNFDPGFPQESIEDLAREVRRQCGCGGTVRDRQIEFQGEDPERFRRIFRDLPGISVLRAERNL
ncbi:MAG: translation initiation factor [Verrucomicrobiae bacterium]